MHSENSLDTFHFDFVPYGELDDDQRFSTWLEVEPLCRGPEPRPDWIVTSQGAIDTELGVLKTGKEADVFLLERSDPHLGTEENASVVMAAKRYRTPEHRSFQRSSAYTEGRTVRRSRDQRAIERKTNYGRQVAAGQWAMAEWQALVRCWELGISVPYPVQIDGVEILMEWITADGDTAPRLVATRPTPSLLSEFYEQLRHTLITMAEAGLVHGDLSPYNILAAGEQLVIIDLPQMVDLIANPQGFDFLLRDCENLTKWFVRRGLDVDAQDLFAEVVTHAV